jgi:hypothetical protein
MWPTVAQRHQSRRAEKAVEPIIVQAHAKPWPIKREGTVRGTKSSQTRRWREPDSNRRSHFSEGSVGRSSGCRHENRNP